MKISYIGLAVFICANAINFPKTNVKSAVKSIRRDNYVLKGANGASFILNDYESGYSILDGKTGVCVEKSFVSTSPYHDYLNSNCFYFGPMEYYVEESDDCFLNIKTGERLDSISYFSSLDIKTNENSNDISLQLSNTNYFDVKHPEYLSDIKDFSYNTDGTCGYLAACLSLYYFYKAINTRFVPSNFITKYGFTESFHKELVNIGQYLKIGNSTTAFDIDKVLKEYSKEYGIPFTCSSTLLSSAMRIDDSIRNDKPVILFGNFVNPNKENEKK